MAISFGTNGALTTSGGVNTRSGNIRFDTDYTINTPAIYLGNSNTIYFNTDYKIYCNSLNWTGGAIKINGVNINTIFEAAYGNFANTSFSNVTPSLSYIQDYLGENTTNSKIYSFISGAYEQFEASPRGYIASNTRIATYRGDTTSRLTLYQTSSGLYVNGSSIYNSSRGSYPINRVGLVLIGGGGGGGTGRKIGTIENSGGGGGGGAIALVTLMLEGGREYNITIGAGGAGGDASGNDDKNGTQGGSTLLVTDGGETLVTCAGGGGGTRGGSSSNAGGSGGAVTHSSADEANYIIWGNGSRGGAGGRGGVSRDLFSSVDAADGNLPSTDTTIGYYINGINNSSANVSITYYPGSRTSQSGGGGGGAGVTDRGTFFGRGGAGGDATTLTQTSTRVSGSAGSPGAVYIFY